MRAYFYDDLPGDQREPHDSGKELAIDDLKRLGITYHNVPYAEGGPWKETIDRFAVERGYKNRDVINVTRAGLGESYESKIKQFFDEHLHEDEEIRYIIGGSGFFDVRGFGAWDNRWIRLAMSAGDLIVLPAGIYHRFTVDTANTITSMRLFTDAPKWTALSRTNAETDALAARQEYIQQVNTGIKA